MDIKDMQGHTECGGCGGCGEHGKCGHGHWGRMIVKVLAVLFIFWLGVQYGELKGMLRATYLNGGYGMMNSYDGRDWGYGPGMMGGWFRETSSQSTTTPN